MALSFERKYSGNSIVKYNIRVCILTLTTVACWLGCEKRTTVDTSTSLYFRDQFCYDGGFVFANENHVVGVDVGLWGLAAADDVKRIQSSCDCVRASLTELDGSPKKKVLVVTVSSDAKMKQNTPLSVSIVASLSDGSSKSLSFQFTHVVAPARK